MQIIKSTAAAQGSNSSNCQTLEYSFADQAIDLGVATITGRYPKTGYCMNLTSKELIYVLEGSGTLYFEHESVAFSTGDSILINPHEKYYWDSSYCKVAMVCTPAWSAEQHVLVQ